MASHSYVAFHDSHRAPPPQNATRIGDVPADERIEVSIYLKPRDDTGAAGASADPAQRRAALHAHRAEKHRGDIARIKEFASEHGLTVVSIEPGKRLVRLAGPAARMEAAFRTKLSHYHDGKRHFRARTGTLSLPDDMTQIVQSVLGMDTRPVAQPRFVHLRNAAVMPGFLPNAVGQLYEFPTNVNGTGQSIGIIELGGGFLAADTAAAFSAMGLSPPNVVAISVDGGQNKPNPDDGADGEVALDIQVAGGVAPGASIAVYFAPNTDAGFADAIAAAAHDATNAPSVISISWGSAEKFWTTQAVQTMNSVLQDAATLNLSVFVASGDNLATDIPPSDTSDLDGKAHVDFPASSPSVIGCGGTSITVSGGTITAEVVWNDGTDGTGGGISDLFPVPSFQENANLPPSVNDGHRGRGVPDVAGDAAPGSGYQIVVNGQVGMVGGTSAVAPLWAGLTALLNQSAGRHVGFLLPFLYANPNLLREVASGDNKVNGIGYSAGPGWNACTGLGVPNGTALAQALAAAPPTA